MLTVETLETLDVWQEGEYLDLDERDMIVLRVRGDGRKYIVSIRTDNWVISGTNHDVWQAFLFAPCAPRHPAQVSCQPAGACFRVYGQVDGEVS